MQHGPGSQGQASPALRYGEQRAGGENCLRCFLDPRRVGAVVCCPRRVSLCRMQLSEAHLGPSVRRYLGPERTSWLRWHGWGLCAEGLRAQSCFPTKKNPWGVGFGHRRPPAKQQGPGSLGSPAPFALWRAGGRGRKRLALLSRSEARCGSVLLPEESFPLQNAAARRLFGAVGATGPRR